MLKSTVMATAGLLLTMILIACQKPAEETAVETPPRSVRVNSIVSRDLPLMISAVGRLIANREVVISAEVPGILIHYSADVGDGVTADKPLARIDDTDYRLALKEAEANLLAARIHLPVAEKAFERARRLLPEKVITPELYDQAEAAFKAAGAQVVQLETIVAQARRRLEKTVIKVPFAGHVTRRFVETGQQVSVGEAIMQVADMRTMRVKIYVNERDYVHVDHNDPVTVEVEAFAGKALPGRVDKIGIQADTSTNTFEIEILVDNPAFDLKAGLTARVSVRTDVIPDAVMIAQQSVLFRENRKEVFVIDADGLAEARTVRLGRMQGADVRILSGLSPGDRLVVSGAQYLKPGDKVRVVP